MRIALFYIVLAFLIFVTLFLTIASGPQHFLIYRHNLIQLDSLADILYRAGIALLGITLILLAWGQMQCSPWIRVSKNVVAIATLLCEFGLITLILLVR